MTNGQWTRGSFSRTKGTAIEGMKHHINLLKDKVHGLNMTDKQSSVMRLSSLVGCHIIKEPGGIPILWMTGRDRVRGQVYV